MPAITPYFVLSSADEYNEEIKKSRFITYLAPTQGRAAAQQFIRSIKALHPDARHHCWGFIAGRPDDGQLYGFSDDGEPSGTAGKPILNSLLGCGIGELTAVVVRYYGGVKLGTGGLVRAYAGGVQQLLKRAIKNEQFVYAELSLTCNYHHIAIIEKLIASHNGNIIKADYAVQVLMQVAVDARQVSAFIRAVTNNTNGHIDASVVDS